MTEQVKKPSVNAGALWKKTSKQGLTFLSGTIKLEVAIFPRKDKKADNHPDFDIVVQAVSFEKKEAKQEPQLEKPIKEFPLDDVPF